MQRLIPVLLLVLFCGAAGIPKDDPGYIGIGVLPATGPAPNGLEIMTIDAGSQAETLGMKVNDRVMAVDARFVNSFDLLVQYLREGEERGYGSVNILCRRGNDTIFFTTKTLRSDKDLYADTKPVEKEVSPITTQGTSVSDDTIGICVIVFIIGIVAISIYFK